MKGISMKKEMKKESKMSPKSMKNHEAKESGKMKMAEKKFAMKKGKK